jgi:hypothetical protein
VYHFVHHVLFSVASNLAFAGPCRVKIMQSDNEHRIVAIVAPLADG